MYEVVFKCPHCSAHLSASADDVDFAFPCPICDEPMAVPAGDILFTCAYCQTSVLASKNTVGDVFDCPHCEQPITVPEQGVKITVNHPPSPAPEQSDPSPTPSEPSAPLPLSNASNTSSGEEREFMSAWGDYMAKAGFTKKTKGSAPSDSDQGAQDT